MRHQTAKRAVMVMRSDFWIACVAALVMAVSPAWIVGTVLRPTSSEASKFTPLPKFSVSSELPAMTRFAFGGASDILDASYGQQPTEFLAMLHSPTGGVAALPLYSLQPAELRRNIADAIGLRATNARPAAMTLDDVDQVRELVLLSSHGAETLRLSMAVAGQAQIIPSATESVDVARPAPVSTVRDGVAAPVTAQPNSAVLRDEAALELKAAKASRLAPAASPEIETTRASLATAELLSDPVSDPANMTVASLRPANDSTIVRPAGASLLGAVTRDDGVNAKSDISANEEPEVLPWLRPKAVKGRTGALRDHTSGIVAAVDGARLTPRAAPVDVKARVHQHRTAPPAKTSTGKSTSRPIRHTWRLASGIRSYHMPDIQAVCGAKSVQCNDGRTVCKC